MTQIAVEMQELINKALDKVERAVQEDPSHVDWYISCKYSLLDADSDLNFCIND